MDNDTIQAWQAKYIAKLIELGHEPEFAAACSRLEGAMVTVEDAIDNQPDGELAAIEDDKFFREYGQA